MRPAPGLGRQKWIQAAIRLAPGNSGGPLANADGRVAGLNRMIYRGVGLAIPASAVGRFLRDGAPGTRLGVVVRPVQYSSGLGLLVLEVEGGGAAEDASLLVGDVLLGADGQRFESVDDLGDALESGDAPIRLEFARGGASKLRAVTVRLSPGSDGRVMRVRVRSRSPVVKAGLEAMLSHRFEIVEEAPEIVVTDAPAAEWGQEVLVVALTHDLAAAVEAAASGLIAVAAENASSVFAPARERATAALTPRELQVLGMIATGLANKEIAYRLGVAESTVKFHAASIMTKLDAGSRTEAVAIGIRQGIVAL
jgi:DNA-binding CsgD family transcriptional regulator